MCCFDKNLRGRWDDACVRLDCSFDCDSLVRKVLISIWGYGRVHSSVFVLTIMLSEMGVAHAFASSSVLTVIVLGWKV
jgi:hypothetical protein